MIASSLAGDDAHTAAQVSRKLKQLGLHVHRQKITEGNMHLRDEDLKDSDMAKEQDSDDETLLSLMKRGKKDNHRLLCEEVLEQKIEGNLMQSSDDETLSSVLKKARRPLNLDEKHTNTSNEGLRIDYPSDHIVVEDITKKMDAPYQMGWKLLELKMVLLSKMSTLMTIQKMKLWPLAVKNS